MKHCFGLLHEYFCILFIIKEVNVNNSKTNSQIFMKLTGLMQWAIESLYLNIFQNFIDTKF